MPLLVGYGLKYKVNKLAETVSNRIHTGSK